MTNVNASGARPRIMLSVAERDDSFDRLVAELAPRADVTTVGLSGYSLAGVDIFIGKKMPAKALAGADKLKAVFAYKTGVDDFPLAEFAERGIMLFNSHINSGYIARYAFALSAALVGRIVEFDRRMRKGDWAQRDPYWRSIFSMRVGLVGYGHIGREIHRLMGETNGIECYTLDRGKDYTGIKTVKTLDELCAVCDILILSLPKTPATENMFDARVFGLLNGKYIVNVGRGNCIDEKALYDALRSHTLAGAAIDAWRSKPKRGEKHIPFDVPLDTLDNIILSSHKAMQVSDGHDRYIDDVIRSVTVYLDGRIPEDLTDCKDGY